MVGFLNTSISICWGFRMMSRSRKLIRLSASSVGELHGVGLSYNRLRVSACDIVNYYNVIHISGIEHYAFRVQEGFDM